MDAEVDDVIGITSLHSITLQDLGAHGIAPREVATRSNFAQKGAGLKRTHPLNETGHNVIPGEAPLQNLIIPAR